MSCVFGRAPKWLYLSGEVKKALFPLQTVSLCCVTCQRHSLVPLPCKHHMFVSTLTSTAVLNNTQILSTSILSLQTWKKIESIALNYAQAFNFFSSTAKFETEKDIFLFTLTKYEIGALYFTKHTCFSMVMEKEFLYNYTISLPRLLPSLIKIPFIVTEI